MNLPKLPCAGKLDNCHQEMKRFHWTCLYCHSRRRLTGKWTEPPYWIWYTQPWNIKTYFLVNEKGEVLGCKQRWRTIKIDPRGHFTALRCAAIVALDRIIAKFNRLRYPLVEVCEFFANYPNF